MAREKTIIGLDVGTCNTRVAVAQLREGGQLQVLGVGKAISTGLRRGVVVDAEEVVKSIKEAVQMAERIAGVPVEHAFVSIGGSHISCRLSRGVIAVSRADGEISREDRERAVAAASAISVLPNREILHILPRRFTVDGQEAIKDPVGMSGVRLEVDALIVEGATPYLKSLLKCIDEADLDNDGMLLAPLADSKTVLTKRQKELGVLLLDLGDGTTGMAVYEEGDVMHCQILPVGGAHITNDIAIGLRISVEAAEKIKLEYGSVLSSAVGKKEMIDLTRVGEADGQASRHYVAEIIEARVCELLDLVNKELKKIDRAGLLPAGVVLVGGGAKLQGLVELTKEKLKLPVQVGLPQGMEGIVDQVADPIFTTVCGLILSAINDDIKPEIRSIGMIGDSIAPTVRTIKKWLKGFLP
ncbi:MAG TPA: cell division protein FtsA [Candidatus Portnoybacteria bacterium]|nr:MAG: cell division protein FtsA [Parcubacteria group bacterium CG2_30_44_18]HCX27870.1 cell division protein FtsA [Candidatus Portnoybacteria bacterium]